MVDTGIALAKAAHHGLERSVKFLLKRREGNTTGGIGYLNNTQEPFGRTPLICAINLGTDGLCHRRIVRLLIDAGADTTLAARFATQSFVERTPLAFATDLFRFKTIMGGRKDATKKQLEILADTRRLLLRVDAVHAVSCLWPINVPSVADDGEGTRRTKETSTPLRMKTRTRRVLVATLCRWGAALSS